MITTAFLWGIVSAISLPIGAFLGLYFKPGRKINSIFMAFGGGALLFALTIELFSHVPHYVEHHGDMMIIVVFSSAIFGGVLFSGLNALLNNYGAFMRRFSTARHFLERLKQKRSQSFIKNLSKVQVLNELPPELMAELMHEVDLKTCQDKEFIFHQGEPPTEMFFIIDGKVDIINHENGNEKYLTTLEEGDSFGELGVLSGHVRSADAVANGAVDLYVISRDDFERLVKEDKSVHDKVLKLAQLRVDDLSAQTNNHEYSERWHNETLKLFEQGQVSVTQDEILDEGESRSKGNAALAIWLGIFIDGIPESLVIGMLAISDTGVSLAFIVGVFLANLPEAMSSSVSMHDNDLSKTKIYLMWGSITLITGIGAGIGATIFPGDPVGTALYFKVGIEAIAAGAMLTMIAETMLPEAFEMGGSVVGLSTLAGFLSALLVKVM